MKHDYRKYAYLETYLLEEVRPRFHQQGALSAFDFFCIVIWKANRVKSLIAATLLQRGYPDLELAVRALTTALYAKAEPKERLRCLLDEWGLRLPMASAILTILYPDEFTIYDVRVCEALGEGHTLHNQRNFERLWVGYLAFKHKVEQATPRRLSLREKDKYLWGQSFYEGALRDSYQ